VAEGQTISIENVPPKAAWDHLKAHKNSALVDCRTQFEWDTIGVPDLTGIDSAAHLIEWRKQPDMSVNPAFLEELDAGLNGAYPEHIFFICRSGARSFEAAAYVQNQLASKDISCTCVNVAEGFEGDPDPGGQRGVVNGWKFNNLPWQIG